MAPSLARGAAPHGTQPRATTSASAWRRWVRRLCLATATFAPSLGAGIGTGYLEAAGWEPGTRVEVEIHGQRVAAETVRGPFRKNSV